MIFSWLVWLALRYPAPLLIADLPKLWLPKRESLHFVDALPMLGTGKLDLRRLKMLAEQQAEA